MSRLPVSNTYSQTTPVYYADTASQCDLLPGPPIQNLPAPEPKDKGLKNDCNAHDEAEYEDDDESMEMDYACETDPDWILDETYK